ncbi:MAG: CYTH domain-containing protein [Gammaproteobacteria bacterium]|nr:CYTH domain-containing protein [Gammaproteobacteria bacterium]
MATEIERKFTLCSSEWRAHIRKSKHFRQGYLVGSEQASVRIRIEDHQANINIKSATLGVVRHEYEYTIPLEDAVAMLNQLCKQPQIEKIRHYVDFAGKTWEIDEFSGDNQGLIVAEIELDSEDEVFELPPWVDQEVSLDTRYYNVCLIENPYKNWQDNDK